MARLRLERLDERVLPSTVIYTETDGGTGAGQHGNTTSATMIVTVTDEDDGTLKWNYHLKNISFTYGADDYWGIGWLVIPVGDSSIVSNVGSSYGADYSLDSPLTQGHNVN